MNERERKFKQLDEQAKQVKLANHLDKDPAKAALELRMVDIAEKAKREGVK